MSDLPPSSSFDRAEAAFTVDPSVCCCLPDRCNMRMRLLHLLLECFCLRNANTAAKTNWRCDSTNVQLLNAATVWGNSLVCTCKSTRWLVPGVEKLCAYLPEAASPLTAMSSQASFGSSMLCKFSTNLILVQLSVKNTSYIFLSSTYLLLMRLVYMKSRPLTMTWTHHWQQRMSYQKSSVRCWTRCPLKTSLKHRFSTDILLSPLQIMLKNVPIL